MFRAKKVLPVIFAIILCSIAVYAQETEANEPAVETPQVTDTNALEVKAESNEPATQDVQSKAEGIESPNDVALTFSNP